MGKKKISAVISYCSNDYRFLGKCIEESKVFADEIVVTVCDHFFSGKKENHILLRSSYAQYPEVTFIEYRYYPKKFYGSLSDYPENFSKPLDLWHATARYIGFFHTKGEYLLFLDSDEIFEGKKMKSWLQSGYYRNYSAMRFLQYFYLHSPEERLKARQIGGLLVKKEGINPSSMIQEYDRAGIFESILAPKKEGIVGLDKQPFVHHYCWVKPTEESLIKLENKTEGNNTNLRDFTTLLKEGYGFRGKIKERERVSSYFDPFSVSSFSNQLEGSPALLVDYPTMYQKEMEYLYGK